MTNEKAQSRASRTVRVSRLGRTGVERGFPPLAQLAAGIRRQFL
ncbi:hypothetical protein [Nostoc sp.]